MKVTLDLEQLLSEGKISQDEYERLSELAAASTGTLAYNILIGFGVIAVGSGALAFLPSPMTALVIGALVLTSGIVILHSAAEQWGLLANICVLTGALLAGGGITFEAHGSLGSIIFVAAIFAVASVIAKSSMLAVLSTLMLAAAIGARTGYFHASYFLQVQEPIITIVLFGVLSYALLKLSTRIPLAYEAIALASARTGVFLVNFGFWVGSLWGDVDEHGKVLMPDTAFSILWACALFAVAVWAWGNNRRWVLNIAAVFGGIHFYTQWFEILGATPGTVLVAGLTALVFAVGLRAINAKIKVRTIAVH